MLRAGCRLAPRWERLREPGSRGWLVDAATATDAVVVSVLADATVVVCLPRVARRVICYLALVRPARPDVPASAAPAAARACGARLAAADTGKDVTTVPAR